PMPARRRAGSRRRGRGRAWEARGRSRGAGPHGSPAPAPRRCGSCPPATRRRARSFSPPGSRPRSSGSSRAERGRSPPAADAGAGRGGGPRGPSGPPRGPRRTARAARSTAARRVSGRSRKPGACRPERGLPRRFLPGGAVGMAAVTGRFPRSLDLLVRAVLAAKLLAGALDPDFRTATVAVLTGHCSAPQTPGAASRLPRGEPALLLQPPSHDRRRRRRERGEKSGDELGPPGGVHPLPLLRQPPDRPPRGRADLVPGLPGGPGSLAGQGLDLLAGRGGPGRHLAEQRRHAVDAGPRSRAPADGRLPAPRGGLRARGGRLAAGRGPAGSGGGGRGFGGFRRSLFHGPSVPRFYFSPAAAKTGSMSTGMSVSFAIVERISGVALPYRSRSFFARSRSPVASISRSSAESERIASRNFDAL